MHDDRSWRECYPCKSTWMIRGARGEKSLPCDDSDIMLVIKVICCIASCEPRLVKYSESETMVSSTLNRNFEMQKFSRGTVCRVSTFRCARKEASAAAAVPSNRQNRMRIVQ